jgi:hypothetical protein
MIGAVVLIPALSHFLLPSGSQTRRQRERPPVEAAAAA